MKRIAAVAVVVLSCASCPEDPPDARAFITALFQASVVCAPSFLAQAEPVFLDAQSRAQIEIAVGTFDRDLQNDKVAFDRASYDACLAAAGDNDCETISAANGPCATVFEGKVDGGGVCAESVECAAGLSCFQDRDACGTCTTIAIEGTSCADHNCADGDFCDDTQVCRAKPAPASFSEGDACSLATGCGGVLSGLACKDGLCAPISIVLEGEACGTDPSSTLYCKDSSSTHFCDGGVCAARPGLGEPCNGAGACDATVAACVDGACVDAGDDGDACENGFGCKLGNTCKSNVCTPLESASQPPACE